MMSSPPISWRISFRAYGATISGLAAMEGSFNISVDTGMPETVFWRHTCCISRMLAYRGTGNTPSSSTVPGKPRCRSSETPHPSRPAAAAMARTPDSDHAEAAREPCPLPAAARRTDEVVKRCRTDGQGLLLKAAKDRPRGLAALAKRFADMQVKEPQLVQRKK